MKMGQYSSFYYKYMSFFFNFPLLSIFEEFNINTQINQSQWVLAVFICRESADKHNSESTSQLKCGFWDVTEGVVVAESRLEFQS